MKTYTTAHLESVPPEYIAQLEKFLGDETTDHGFCCMRVEFGDYVMECETYNEICPDFMQYCPDVLNTCPCSYFGSFEKAKAAALNLIKQWKEWAQI